ncbi:MAG TPA: PhzF family phenazine biosynthesis protein [Acidimicrobiales bacterium]|nr:PhzF family phenazine biosynthesis protein [Acidimicrobiales bacterium]
MRRAMELEYVLVDVFAETPLAGNALAVFPDAAGLSDELMLAIARETNLSETVFVTSAAADAYASRIFTPGVELPFAGHPTLGTAWVLRSLGRIADGAVTQETKAGATAVDFDGDTVWLERSGDGGTDDADVPALTRQLGADDGTMGLMWSDADGNPVRLTPAVADAGIPQVMVPLESPHAVDALRASDIREPEGTFGAYFFSFTGTDTVKARFFGAGVGVTEDAATGSAAAGLGLYLGQRLGPGRVRVSQGGQIGRPSILHVQFDRAKVRVGGDVVPIGRGVLTI